MNKLILLFLFIPVFQTVFCQDYYDNQTIRYDNFIYKDEIATVKLHKTGNEFSQPIIQLNSGEQLKLTFDNLKMKATTYYYTFILCNSKWQPVDLLPLEYLEGFTEDYFNTSFQSYSTRTSYVNYQLSFPNEQMKIKKSGNYLLKVYEDGNPEDLVLTKRFYVYESKVNIDAKIEIPLTAAGNKTHQELNLSLIQTNYRIPNIYENLSIHIYQNQRLDNAKILSRPKGVSNNNIIYSQPGDMLFEAGNEFRNFDTRSLQSYSSRIRAIETDSNGYHVLLVPDGSRMNRNYIRYADLNGQFTVLSYDNTIRSSDIEGDYAWVSFVLPMEQPLTNGSIFIFGALTDWKINSENRLKYDAEKQVYEAVLYLKQGYYDYQYLFFPDNSKVGQTALLEGNFSETENEYSIFVYYKEPGDNYDKLIAYQSLNSKK